MSRVDHGQIRKIRWLLWGQSREEPSWRRQGGPETREDTRAIPKHKIKIASAMTAAVKERP